MCGVSVTVKPGFLKVELRPCSSAASKYARDEFQTEFPSTFPDCTLFVRSSRMRLLASSVVGLSDQQPDARDVSARNTVVPFASPKPSMRRRAKFHPRIRTREILLVAVGDMPVITEEIDSGESILQRQGCSPFAGFCVAFHIHPLVFGDLHVQERGGTCRSAIIDPPHASACRLRALIETHTDT